MNLNTWNKIRYTVYAPVYNAITNIFKESRRKAIGFLDIQPGQKVLIIGAGTGLDIPFINQGAHINATDITPAMIRKIKMDYPEVHAVVMDGQHLEYSDNSFDHVILHLILAVIPDPVKCIKEVERVLKPNGKISVFDKFIEGNKQPGMIRKMMNILTSTLFSDINRNLENILSNTSLKTRKMEKANFRGAFKIFLLIKENKKASID